MYQKSKAFNLVNKVCHNIHTHGNNNGILSCKMYVTLHIIKLYIVELYNKYQQVRCIGIKSSMRMDWPMHHKTVC